MGSTRTSSRTGTGITVSIARDPALVRTVRLIAAAVARRDGFDLFALSFRYGQRHVVELGAATRVAQALGVARHLVLDLDLSAIGGSALTTPDIEVPRDRPCQLVGGRPVRDPGRTEDRHRRPDPGERVESLDELREDPQRPPGIAADERRLAARSRLQELLVLGPAGLADPLHGVAANEDPAVPPLPRHLPAA